MGGNFFFPQGKIGPGRRLLLELLEQGCLYVRDQKGLPFLKKLSCDLMEDRKRQEVLGLFLVPERLVERIDVTLTALDSVPRRLSNRIE